MCVRVCAAHTADCDGKKCEIHEIFDDDFQLSDPNHIEMSHTLCESQAINLNLWFAISIYQYQIIDEAVVAGQRLIV